jgi:hypothetical protein
MSSGLVGAVIERTPTGAPRAPTASGAALGFPAPQHRAAAKSAFARAREARADAAKEKTRLDAPPALHTSSPATDSVANSAHTATQKAQSEAEWAAQMAAENDARVAGMSDDERAEEVREILARFGAGVGDVLAKRRARLETGVYEIAFMGLQTLIPTQILPCPALRTVCAHSLELYA